MIAWLAAQVPERAEDRQRGVVLARCRAEKIDRDAFLPVSKSAPWDGYPKRRTYTTAVTLTKSTTVKFRAWDKAGNIEATKSQTINVR
jgi:hypothetical protein